MTSSKMAKAEQLCQERGERFTEPRRVVYSLLLQHAKALTAYQILDLMQSERPGAKPPTVYRALDFLMKLGLIHRVDSSNAYLICHGGDHEHQAQFLICNQCGAVTEVELPALEPEIHSICEEKGFKPDQQIVEIRGLCSRCR